MFKIIIPLIAVLFFVQPVVAQEKVPELPDYTKLKLSNWELGRMLYEGNPVYILYKEYDVNNGTGSLAVWYKPISQGQYSILQAKERQEGWNQQEIEKQVHTLAGKEPLFVYYLESEYGKYAHIYERTSRWYEFYRLWRPEWILVKRFANPNASENRGDIEKIEKFIEQKYGLSWSNW